MKSGRDAGGGSAGSGRTAGFSRDSLLLYAVTDRRWLHGGSLAAQVRAALVGGATMVQLREKNMDADPFLKEAKELREVCRLFQVPFIINDRVDIALAVDADGVHVGQEDMEAVKARERIGPGRILGVSAHSVKEALLAEESGADYLGAGAVFCTDSKGNAGILAHEELQRICEAVEIPVVAIGGIGEENILELKGRGISGVAVISGIFGQNDIREAAGRLRSLSEEVAGRKRFLSGNS